MPRVRSNQQLWLAAPEAVMAYPWVERDDYREIVAVMIDGDLWPRDYDVWRREAERAMESLSMEGVSPVKVRLEPDEFLAWCRANECAPDSRARLAFAELAALDGEDPY